MAQKTNYPLSVTIKAIDKATAPIRAINAQVLKMGDTFSFKKLGGGLENVGKTALGVKSEVASLGAKLLGFGTIAGLGLAAMTKSAVDAGDKLGEMSGRLKVGVDFLAAFSHAAEQSDVSTEDLYSSLDMFSKGVGQAKAGTGRLLAFLNKVSPTLAKQVKGAKSTEEAVSLMAGAMVKVTDPSKRAALAMAAFGNAQMGEFLGQGPEAIKELTDRFRELAGPQAVFAERMGVLDNTFKETGTAMGGLRNAVLTELSPAFNRLAIFVTDLITKHGDKLVQWAREANDTFQAWANSGGLERLTKSIVDIAGKISNAIDRMGGLQNVAMMVAAVMGAPLAKSVFDFGMALGGIGVHLVRGIGWMGGWVKYLWMMRASLGPALLIPLKAAAAASWAFMAPWLPLAAAILGVGAALYQVNKHWDELKQAGFSDVGAWLKNMVGIKETDEQSMQRMNKGVTGAAGARPMLGAAAAAPPIQSSRQTNDARVSVDFSNLPKGARVTPSPDSTAQLDLSMGYSMVSP